MRATTIKAGRFGELPDGEMRAIDSTRGAPAICRIAQHAYAFENRCTDELFVLIEGYLEPGEMECTVHGARFA